MVCPPESSTVSLVPGDVLGRYVIIRPLGRGAAGTVYEAHDPRLDRRVALKILHGGGADQDALLHEARGLARVDHPNVVSIHELGEVEGQVFVAMELVQGETLAQWLQRQPRTARQIVEVMQQAGAGLRAVHDAGLVHRDFKPSNVLIGRDGRVRVADFGLARSSAHACALADSSCSEERAETASDIAGTPAYMPPEAFDGLHRGVSCDLWAFAVVLCEALGGAHPFAARHTAEYLAKICDGTMSWGPQASSVPVSLRRVIRPWLDADVRRRPQSMNEILDALRVAVRPRRRLKAATGLMAVVLTPWLAVSIAAPVDADLTPTETCASAHD